MFGGAKPTFGAGTGTAFGATPFTNTANASPFGQSTFGKPATSTFGTTPAFGAQQSTPSLFGQNAAQPQPTGLFGNTSSTFGATTTTPAFGAFSQPQQNTSIFGAAQPAANTSSLFSQPATSAFGSAVKPAGLGGFAQASAQPSTSLFGQATASTSTGGFGSFGQAAPTTTNVFGSGGTSAFGQTAVAGAANAGSSIAKYQPTIGTDTLMKAGQPNNVNTKQHCITAMKEYETKSLEEIRMEDYLANRKGATGQTGSFFGGGQPATGGTGLFGATSQPTTGLFGQAAPAQQTENKGLFGTTTFGQPAATSAFGQPAQQQNSFMAKPFGAPAAGGFGATGDAANNPFGAKPAFGQAAPTMFGQTPASSAAPSFGQTTSGFGGFGSTAGTAQQPSLFGQTADANKPAFGLGAPSTANTGFGGFGTTTTSTASGGGGLFGSKPATGGFGTAPAFGATSTANTGFGNFSLNNTAAGNTGGGLFNSSLNKPATSGFGGFGTQTAAPLNFNSGASTGGSFFGNTANKPGGLFGNSLGGTNTTATGGGGLFGGGNTNFSGGSTLGGGFGQTSLGGNTSLGGGLGCFGGQQQQQQQQQQTVPIHQQILSKVTSPYGDNPIFKDLKRNDEVDATRATNPAAQKPIIDSTTANVQFKLSAKPSPVTIKVTPVGSAISKKSLFDGLEEFDSSVESFRLKPNAKRLVLKSSQSPGVLGKSPSVVVQPSTSSTAQNASGHGQQATPGGASAEQTRNESFNGEIPATNPPLGGATAAGTAANDYSRRESWLHPNNLEKVRQHNLNAGLEAGVGSPLNNSLSELVPRKPLETFRSTLGGGGGSPSKAAGARLSMSTVPENPFEDQQSTLSAGRAGDSTVNDSIFSNRSYGGGAGEDRSVLAVDSETGQHFIDYDEHPTGITLRRVGYYTIPSMDDLKSYLAEDGSCVVPNFTVGREGYGNVYFGKEMDVANLNLDEIVHFRNKEIIIYPDDDNKPPVGAGLNREAQVTLDQVWPLDKTKHESIKDPHRLLEMDWEGRLRRVCDKNDTRFIEYRPETGSWVFRVKHFSKYGLNDSDEDEPAPVDPKKAKMVVAGPGDDKAAKQLDPKMLALRNSTALAAARGDLGHSAMDQSADFMLMDKTQFLQNELAASHQQDYNNSFQSPTATLAKEQGMDAFKLQLMKASFFVNDDADENDGDGEGSLHSEFPHLGQRQHHATAATGFFRTTGGQSFYDGAAPSEASTHMPFGSLLSPAVPPSSSSASVMSGLRDTDGSSPAVPCSESTSAGTVVASSAMQLKKKLPPFVVRPRVSHIKMGMVVQLPFAKSLGYGERFSWPGDLGVYNVRRFKMGFGPQNTFIVPTTKHNLLRSIKNENMLEAAPEIFRSRAANDLSATVLQQVRLSSTLHYENFQPSVAEHLQIQLRHAQIEEVEGSECPWIKPDCGTQLIVQHLDEAIKQMNLGPLEEYSVSVWSLCLALWGEHEELEGREASSHVTMMSRRNLLSEWLENTLTDKDLLTQNVTKQSYLDYMLELIMSHKVIEACELAFRYDDGNLALLLSQLSSGPIVRQLMEDQLAEWHKDKADKYIELERLKLFMLIAGVSLMTSAHGPINILDSIDWIKVVALQLWYLSSPTSSITDALFAYDKSFKSEEFYSMPPSPHYLDSEGSSPSRQFTKTQYDLRYHLLKLYSTRSHPMEGLLNPVTHTPDPMDYRLSWLMLQVLESLGYRHCGELNESQIHVGFAAQLENNDMWEWAIFVLLHIKDRNQREIAVQNLLYRYVSVSKDVTFSDKEKFVINSLSVPEKWIDYAKAVKAGATGNRHLQAKYLLKAKQWSLAHDVIFQYIAPDAVINDNLDYLHELLTQFETEMHKYIKVPNWSVQGQIFLDFIEINDKFKCLKMLKSEADIEARWENLKPQLADLCSRINLMPCPTPKHRLCQSEIAQNLSCLVRGVLIVCPVLNPCLIIKIALERLPLPQEFAQQELRTLLDTLVKDLAKTTNTEGAAATKALLSAN